MAIHPVLTSGAALVPANVHISHIQLRDLILCPRDPGLVCYVHHQGIVEHDLYAPSQPPRLIATPAFHPNTLAAFPIPDSNDILYAAGGQDADLHFSYHAGRRRSKQLWSFSKHLDGCSINNSLVFLSRSNESAVEPRAIVSNNDTTVKFFDVPLRTIGSKHSRDLKQVGLLNLDVPVNHTSLSPDARTVLSVGDSSQVFLHHISGQSRLAFTPIATLPLPKPQGIPLWLPQNALAASFSTAFSADGAKFAVASQEGLVAVWDVRSTKPMKVFQTDKSAGLGPAPGAARGTPPANGLWAGGAAAFGWTNSAASGWLFEDAHLHGSGGIRAPGWSVRNVKFGGGVGGSGKELMVFTEHWDLLHIVDAKTFETEQVVRVPGARASPSLAPLPMRPRPSSESARPPPRSPGTVDYVYSQLPGFARRSNPRHLPPGPYMRARELLSRLTSSDENDDRNEEENNGGGDDNERGTRPGYSPPSSIGDSTLRALRTAGGDDDAGGRRSRSAADMVSSLNRVLGERPLEGIDEEAALLLIPGLVEGVEDILNRHSIFGDAQDGRSRRRQEEGDEREEEEEEEEDRNTGSTAADFEYPYEFGDSSVWREENRTRRTTASEDPEGDVVRGYNRREEDGVELDLAGVCFDPSGGHVYVASTKSVVEWNIRGADKRWWSSDAWM